MTAPRDGRPESPLVLVADDDHDILALVSLRLKKAGYGVVTATDGVQALKAVREHRPELAVVDVRMPEMDGLELIRRIRADGESAGMRVIALSAGASDANLDEGLGAGADAYMTKPFNAKQLVELVESTLSAGEPAASRD
jgi:CheY-like chemotaxis protein